MEKTTLKDELLSYIVAGIVNLVLGAIICLYSLIS